MRIILTHEQADFDAIASLLGAHLLDDSALPVLPRRMNRNVRAFLTLYGVDLPFVDPRDLPNEPIDAVTLVDTQALTSVRGLVAHPRVQVIDHHPRRDDLPADWEVTFTDTGATTTLLVEALRERDVLLPSLAATLLLIGIYEDTGSLTYDRTSSRDLRAAAALLDSGADLNLAADFINHPLSSEQRILYDELRAANEHFHIHGHTVMIACSDASTVDEELSSVVHKLRDLLDPDALFVLFQTRGGVQIIARSATDHIDVAAILGRFGGGGHERAAAGLIRDRSLASLRAELIRLLPEMVIPAVTVAQLMSADPHLLPPDTPVEEAARLMRRYGYEGYPVVQRGEAGPDHILGLLTRRAVDRAIAHHLNLTAASLMEAGDFAVRPGDSLDDLQRLMTDSGWGQMPVMDTQGRVIGIVTRTDLLKTLNPHTSQPFRHNLSERLERALPAARLTLLRAIAHAAQQQPLAVYIVGGYVRDLLLDRPGLDFDLVVEGDAIRLARQLARDLGGRVTTHARFGTAKWHIGPVREDVLAALDGRDLSDAWTATSATLPVRRDLQADDLPDTLDFISARTEFYAHPTALPTVERGSIKLDLHRRDFTINTLALRLDGRHFGELHDHWGGLADLRHGLVRVLHSLSFVDDPTRMLRAVRFEQRFGFRIEQRTQELLGEALGLLDRVSGDRVRHELEHVLAETQAPLILARLDELGLLAAIHPRLHWDAWLQTRLEALPLKVPDADWELGEQADRPAGKHEVAFALWLLRLDPEEIVSVAARLKFSAHLLATVSAANRLWHDLPQLVAARPSDAVIRLEDAPPLARYAVYLATSDIRLRRTLQTYATHWRKVQPTISGLDLQQRGLPPGPRYRQILWRLRQAWLDKEITSAAQEQQLLETLLAAPAQGGPR
jgi:tRNA nucleotidyltransferase (CCA-adding enzyme)